MQKLEPVLIEMMFGFFIIISVSARQKIAGLLDVRQDFLTQQSQNLIKIQALDSMRTSSYV